MQLVRTPYIQIEITLHHTHAYRHVPRQYVCHRARQSGAVDPILPPDWHCLANRPAQSHAECCSRDEFGRRRSVVEVVVAAEGRMRQQRLELVAAAAPVMEALSWLCGSSGNDTMVDDDQRQKLIPMAAVTNPRLASPWP